MRSHRSNRLILLFLTVVVLPTFVLVVLSFRMIQQERELEEKRLADNRSRLIQDISSDLLIALERIRSKELDIWESHAASPDRVKRAPPEVVMVAWKSGDDLQLPWDRNSEVEVLQMALREEAFALQIASGNRVEFAQKLYREAIALYRSAMEAADHPAQLAFSRLSLARALSKSGQSSQAHSQYRKLLALSSRVADEHGIPFAFYAARALVNSFTDCEAVLERIRNEVKDRRWHSPGESYLLRDLIDACFKKAGEETFPDEGKDLQVLLQKRIEILEQALALHRDFPTLGWTQPNQEDADAGPVWFNYGADGWLLRYESSVDEKDPALVAVRAEEILQHLIPMKAWPALDRNSIRFSDNQELEAEVLGANFPGLRVVISPTVFAPDSGKRNLQRAYYIAALALILCITIFGSYLLWRDVRRELRIAELRSQFVASVSHELKTPLTAIRMFAETLRLGRVKQPKDQGQYLDTIVNESERLTRLLNNVLDFSKIERNEKRYSCVPTDLAKVLDGVSRTMQYPLEQDGFSLSVEVDTALPNVHADSDAVAQAVLNLLSNAMKYSGKPNEISMRLRGAGDYAVIEVADQGVGIDAKEHERIFGKFYRVASPENDRVPGAGLGLALVHHIAAAHGGFVKVQSTPGDGSTFSIYLLLEKPQ